MKRKRGRIAAIALTVIAIGLLVATAAASFFFAAPGMSKTSESQNSSQTTYIIAGGQDGEWFTPGQYPDLYKVSTSLTETVQTSTDFALSPLVTLKGQGTVWSVARSTCQN